MAKFDTTSIAGFESMTAEQKVAALMSAEIPDEVDMSKYVSKETFDKKASEAASLSKQLKDRMSDEDKKKVEDQELLTKMQEQIDALTRDKDTLLKDKTVSEYTAKYLALGYDKDLAAETAKAMAEGDMQKVFANGEKHKTALEKSIKEQLMKDDPRPGGGKDKDKESAAVEQAKQIGKQRAAVNGTAADVMKHYLK